MFDTQQSKLPAVFLYGFGTPKSVSLASELQSRGFAVVVACAPGQCQAAETARSLGCAVIESERGEAFRGGVESLLAEQYDLWYADHILRAGLLYFQREMSQLPGIVSTDASTGYSVEDVISVSAALLENPDHFILASRRTDPKSGLLLRLERASARAVFRLVHGRKLEDPWADLRAIPSRVVSPFLELNGTGKGYEFNMVLNLRHKGVKAVSTPVSAVYARGPGATGKTRLLDLIRIVLVPLLFISSSLTLTVSDYCMRFLFYYVILRGNEPVSLAVGFYTGAFVGYMLNRNLVFRQKTGKLGREFVTILKYALLTTFNYYIAHLLVSFFMNSFHASFPLASIIASVLLYAPNFLIQREIVFRRSRTQEA